MKKAPKKDLVVIGTARKPNASDLRNRGLSGLPDPSPEVALRRAEFELEQEALRAQVALLQGENELSFLRTKIGVHRSTDDDASGLDPGIVASKMSGGRQSDSPDGSFRPTGVTSRRQRGRRAREC